MAEATDEVDSPSEGAEDTGDVQETEGSSDLSSDVAGSRTGTIYRGKSGMWVFYLHRITGISILAFLLLHIADVAAIGWGRNAYNTIHALYESLFFRFFEVALLGALLFHALNGIRIVIIDMWDRGAEYQKELTLAVGVAFAALFGSGAATMFIHYFNSRGH